MDEIDINKVISHKLYRRQVEFNDGFCLKDLDKLGKDIKKFALLIMIKIISNYMKIMELK